MAESLDIISEIRQFGLKVVDGPIDDALLHLRTILDSGTNGIVPSNFSLFVMISGFYVPEYAEALSHRRKKITDAVASHQNRDLFVSVGREVARFLAETSGPQLCVPLLNALADIAPSSVEVRLQAGDFNLKAGDKRKATEHFSEALRLDSSVMARIPSEVQPILEGAVAEHSETSRFDYLANSPPEMDADSWYSRGRLFMQEKRIREALESFEEAIKIQPLHVDALYWKGVALAALERHGEALDMFREVTELSPQDAFAWYDRGLLSIRAGIVEEGVTSLQKAIEIKPSLKGELPPKILPMLEQKSGTPKDWLRRGLALSEQRYRLDQQGASAEANQHAERAIGCYDEVLSLDPDNSEASYWKGIELGFLDRPAAAAHCLQRAITLAPALKSRIPQGLQDFLRPYGLG